jgi:hypothetical protein
MRTEFTDAEWLERLAPVKARKAWDAQMGRTWKAIAVDMAKLGATVYLDRIERGDAFDFEHPNRWVFELATCTARLRGYSVTHDYNGKRHEYEVGYATRVHTVNELGDLLVIARVAYRLDNPKSRGDRDYVLCNAPDAESDTWGELRRAARVVMKCATCRYCRETLIAEARLGANYTTATCEHTVSCALRFLAGYRGGTW